MNVEEIMGIEKAPEAEKPDFNQQIVERWFGEIQDMPSSQRCEALNHRLNGFLSLKEIDPSAYAQQVKRGLDEERLLECCNDKCGMPVQEEVMEDIEAEDLEDSPAGSDIYEETPGIFSDVDNEE